MKDFFVLMLKGFTSLPAITSFLALQNPDNVLDNLLFSEEDSSTFSKKYSEFSGNHRIGKTGIHVVYKSNRFSNTINNNK